MASQKIYVDLDLGRNQVMNVVAHVLAGDPASPTEGQFYYNSTSKTLGLFVGGGWISFGRLDQMTAPTASVGLNNQKITNLGAPTVSSDATTKAYVDARRLDEAAAPTASVNLNNQKITNLAEPTVATDAATKNYVDNAIQGLDVKASVRVASVSNVAIATAPSSIDGVTLSNGDRVLLKDQTTGSQNGIYVFTTAGAALTRATDFDNWAEIPGSFTFVEEGTAAGRGYVCTNNRTGTLGTTAITFTIFSSAGTLSLTPLGNSATLGNVTLAGNVLSVKGLSAASSKVTVTSDAANVNIDVNATNIAADPAFTGVFAKRFVSNTFVMGTASGSQTITHNLNSEFVNVSVYNNTNKEEVMVGVVSTGVNTVRLDWNAMSASITGIAIVTA